MISSSSSSSNSLAPGFRFHPTDEELVSYYLKRKVAGLPLRVDVIAEIDLYKREPWDLPSLSRLRTRDVEWYFFSPLDRKSESRPRTNRATEKGYWKTTGKDRPVKRGSKVAGMKKTLVFHLGRAPRAQRTNWVMHEYRLEDPAESAVPAPDLVLSQDSFVVCRIFQKSGSGPQNGAQYGAPFIEEEWEDGGYVPKNEALSDDIMYAGGVQENVHANHSAKEQVLSDEHESAVLEAKSEEQDGGSHADDPTVSLEDILDFDTCIGVPEVQNNPNISINVVENSSLGEQAVNPSRQNDGYLELRDIFDNANGPCNSFGDDLGVQNGHFIENSSNDATSRSEVDGTDFCFDITNGTAICGELNQMSPPAENVFNPQPLYCINHVPADCLSVQPTEDNIVFYDASTDNPHSGDMFDNTEGIQFSSAADLDMLDDLMAYFDATDNNLLYDIFSSSDAITQPCSVSQGEVNNCPPYKPTLPVPEKNMEMVASSSARIIDSANQLEGMNKYNAAAPGMEVTEGWNKTFKQRVVNMLGSISAPPAMAVASVNGKEIALLSTRHLPTSVHVTTGLIQIHGKAVTGSNAEYWILQNKGDTSHLLSSSRVDKSVCFETVTKVQGGAFGVLLGGGFYLFGLSLLILSASLKVGLCVYNK